MNGERPVTPAVVFNCGVLAHAIAAADQLGLFSCLEQAGQIILDDFALEHGEAIIYLQPVIRMLEVGGILVSGERSGEWLPGPTYAEYVDVKGLFRWLFSASGDVLAVGPQPGREANAGCPEVRDGAEVSASTADFGRRLVDPYLFALPELRAAQGVVDLGCGDASRLLSVWKQWGIPGLGVDQSAAAIQRAQKLLITADAIDHVKLLCSDVRALEAGYIAPDYDVIMCSLMGHDLWPEEDCQVALGSLRSVFPSSRVLILCETVSSSNWSLGTQIPSLGYEYLHALMHQYIPSHEDWLRVLAKSGWRVSSVLPLKIPGETYIYVCHA